jgi:hypothetical protein
MMRVVLLLVSLLALAVYAERDDPTERVKPVERKLRPIHRYDVSNTREEKKGQNSPALVFLGTTTILNTMAAWPASLASLPKRLRMTVI